MAIYLGHHAGGTKLEGLKSYRQLYAGPCHCQNAEVLPGNSLMGPSWKSLFISVDAGPEWAHGRDRLRIHGSGRTKRILPIATPALSIRSKN